MNTKETVSLITTVFAAVLLILGLIGYTCVISIIKHEQGRDEVLRQICKNQGGFYDSSVNKCYALQIPLEQNDFSIQ